MHADTSLKELDQALAERFLEGDDVAELVRERAAHVDSILKGRWTTVNRDDIALVAVGGYGRGELHPASDIDIMILLPDDCDPGSDAALGEFVTALWDIGFDVGHSVRNVSDCVAQARADVTVTTTLMEARRLAGPPALFERMQEAVSARQIWPSAKFFAAKRREQIARHRRYDDTGYNLEPNVKGSPGGLRDIQMIGWVAKRHFGVATIAELVDHHFLTPGQLRILNRGQEFLWRVRYALHLIAERREDRLLFDHQVALANMLGYEDASYTLGVEQMMQRYYRTVMDLSRLNEMLLQLFEEAILMDPTVAPQPLNERFEIRNGFLKTTHDEVFLDDPSALLEIFLLLQQTPDLRGVSALTIGLIKRSLHLIDEEFRQNPRNHRLFLAILRAPKGVTHELRRMNLYGVLGLYLPAFGRIVGRMQYDLFHAYTVDEHTLFVVSNLRKFALSEYNDEYPHCGRVMQSLEKPEIAYLAGLFHDIAKGRGGDHSELGAVDAEAFCLEHGLSRYDAEMVAWLVRQHLALSMTAQKKDIGDPDVINEFAALVGDQLHLDYLYVLTVADVRGTNPKLWNSWKETLFKDLYKLTSRALRRGLENPVAREQLIREKQQQARASLLAQHLTDADIDKVWSLYSSNYFVRHKRDEIDWHTRWLSAAGDSIASGGCDVRQQDEGVEAILYTPKEHRTFAQATAVVDELGMTIVDARIEPLTNGFSLDTYVFMELDKRNAIDESRLAKIQRALQKVLQRKDDDIVAVTRALPRQAKVFKTRTSVDFVNVPRKGRTVMELVAADRPGLLSMVGQVFIEQRVDIHTAKIVTIGERAEDVFHLTDESGAPLDATHQDALRDALIVALDSPNTH